MAEQPRSANSSVENESSNTDQAGGSREHVNTDAGGISNRPLSEENEDQEQLPPRGQSKGESHAE